MQKNFGFAILSIYLIFAAAPARSADDSLRALRQLSNEIYRYSQDMIFHGSEGHADEIVSYGKKMIERAEKLMKEVDAHPPMKTKKEKEKMIASLKGIVQKANEAVTLAEQRKTDAAIAASRKASFQAKQLRQQFQALN
jgi:predicted translin family RNA/ssDNA-binding protein